MKKSFIESVIEKSKPSKLLTRDSFSFVAQRVYRKFNLENVNVFEDQDSVWTVQPQRALTVSSDDWGRSAIALAEDATLYLVFNGTDREFKRLGANSGIRVDSARCIAIDSQSVSSGNLFGKLVILEFDESGERVGELALGTSGRWVARLLDETRFILPTVRLNGQGSFTFDWLRLSFSKSTFAGEHRLKRITSSSEDPVSSVAEKLGLLERSLHAARNDLKSLSSLREIPGPKPSEVGGAFPTEAIADNRESMVRSLLQGASMSIPDSDGSHHYGKVPAKVGIITDVYMYNFYKDCFEELVYLSPSNYRQILAEKNLDAIIYVTCWRGLENDEWKGVKYREAPAKALQEILEFATDHRIPTIFQSIEDPSNFDYFLEIARKFDYVLTSAEESIGDYKAHLGHSRVRYGEYGANPHVNNPIGNFRINIPRFFFAGSYPERYPERTHDMKTIFNAVSARDENLLILDRNYHGEGFSYPEKFAPSIIGPVEHQLLQKVHKLFNVSFNFNSIKDSATMCAMRVYELQANGLPIISNYSRSVFNKFPGIRIVDYDTVLPEPSLASSLAIDLGLANEMCGELLTRHSSYEVAGKWATWAEIGNLPARSFKVAVLCADAEVSEVEQIASRQQGVETIVIPASEFSDHAIPNGFDYATWIDPAISYSRFYLLNKLAAFVYTSSLFATQQYVDPENTSGEEYLSGNEYTDRAVDRALTVVSTDLEHFGKFLMGDQESIDGKGYVTSPIDVGYWDWIANRVNSQLQEPRLTVIIPVFNNGRFLKTKCLPSLFRNKTWNRMSIVLVDDGSSDEETIEIVRFLGEHLNNVTVFEFKDGGSGSASRPRNKGIELCQTELLTFLDPDNEISDGGYDALLAEFDQLWFSGEPVDFVSGFQVKIGRDKKITGKHADAPKQIFRDPIESFFSKGKFPVVSSQAAVIRKDLLDREKIAFVENAIGQDTLFGWELLLSSKTAAFTNTAHLLYYAERAESVTNSVTEDFFNRSLVLEEAQVKVLENYGILDFYTTHKLEPFLEQWYRVKLNYVREDQRHAAEVVLEKIEGLYRTGSSYRK